MKSFLEALFPWSKGIGWGTKVFSASAAIGLTLFMMPGCIYKYTIGDKLEEEKELKAYQEKWLTVCTGFAYRAMRDYGEESWKLFIDEPDPNVIRPEGLECSKVVPAIEKVPGLMESYQIWVNIE